MPEPINLSDFPSVALLREDLENLNRSSETVNLAFRQLAIYETASIDEQIGVMLASKIREVKAVKPELTDTEAYIVAGRLLKQLISCYQSALQQLLP